MRVISIRQISEELNVEEGVIYKEIQKLVESPNFRNGKLRFIAGSKGDVKVFIVDYDDLDFIRRNAEKGPIFLADYFKLDRDTLINLIEQMRAHGVITHEIYKIIFEVKDKPALKSWFEPDVIMVGGSSSLHVEIYTSNIIEKPTILLNVPSNLEVIMKPETPEKLFPGRFVQSYLLRAETHGEYKVIVALEGVIEGKRFSDVTSMAPLKVKPFPPEIEVELLTSREVSATLNREFNIILQIRNFGRGDCLNISIGGLEEYKNFVIVSGALIGNLAPGGVLKHTLRLRSRKSGKFTLDKLFLSYQDAEGKAESKPLPPIIVEVKTPQPELKIELTYPQTKIKEGQEFPLTIRVVNVGRGEARNIFMRLPIPPELIISGHEELFIPKINADSSEDFELILRAPREKKLEIGAFNVEFEDEEGNREIEGCLGASIPISVEEPRPAIFEKPWPFIPGSKIKGRYLIIKEIGEGGFAKVYLAKDLITGQEVALKALKPNFIRDLEKIERFISEAKIAMDLRDPHIVAIYHVDMEEYEEDKYPFIVMEYLPDGTLEKRLIPGQPSQLNEVLAVLEDICEALLSAHENRIIHGDIKPSNIFYYGRKKMWKLGDFSLSIIMRGKESESRGGTPFYMAPEVKEGKITEKSDIYSLGVMMREMLTGRRGVDLSKVREIYKGLNENQLRELERLVERMTDPDPAKRPHIREIYGLLRKFETFH